MPRTFDARRSSCSGVPEPSQPLSAREVCLEIVGSLSAVHMHHRILSALRRIAADLPVPVSRANRILRNTTREHPAAFSVNVVTRAVRRRSSRMPETNLEDLSCDAFEHSEGMRRSFPSPRNPPDPRGTSYRSSAGKVCRCCLLIRMSSTEPPQKSPHASTPPPLTPATPPHTSAPPPDTPSLAHSRCRAHAGPSARRRSRSPTPDATGRWSPRSPSSRRTLRGRR